MVIHSRIGRFVLAAAIGLLCGCSLNTSTTSTGVGSAGDDRLDWWRDARFGMFIHWGLYAIPAGEWKGNTNYAEWIRHSAQIPIDTYDTFVGQFNPVNFDADQWVLSAKRAGMKYIVITSKHHDGFCLWDSELTEYDVMSTPFARDILKELSDACERHGIRFCFYHSIMDWHHPDYLPRRGWEQAERPVGDADFDRYVQYMQGQVTELLTEYGDIGVMWFDGEWEATWTHEYGQPLYDLCLKLKPDVIVNDRVDVGRQGHTGHIAQGFAGDYATPEQHIPGEGPGQGLDWETCMTMNGHWGFNRVDRNFKSTTDLIRKLIDIASKGGNFLLNVGPKADGTFPQESIDRLNEVGEWMDVHGDAIYGTQLSPFGNLPWGRCTMKPRAGGSTLYFHVFDWPADGRLVIDGIGSKVGNARTLAEHDVPVSVSQREGTITIDLPSRPSNPHATVVAVDIDGDLIIYDAPRIVSGAFQFVDQAVVRLETSSNELVARYTLDGSTPTGSSPLYGDPIVLQNTTTIRARSFHHGKAVSGVAESTIEKVLPAAGVNVVPAGSGLVCREIDGTWDVLPDFASRQAGQTRTVASINPDPKAEHIARRFEGLLRVDRADVYDFMLRSDDGSRLLIGGELVVDNDGLHGPEEKRGVVALGRGWHRIVVEWFNKTGGADLDLRWAPAGQQPPTHRRAIFGSRMIRDDARQTRRQDIQLQIRARAG